MAEIELMKEFCVSIYREEGAQYIEGMFASDGIAELRSISFS